MNIYEVFKRRPEASVSKLTPKNLCIFSVPHQSYELEFEIVFCEKCKNYFIADFWSHYVGLESNYKVRTQNQATVNKENDSLSEKRAKPSTILCPECGQRFRKLWPWEAPEKTRY